MDATTVKANLEKQIELLTTRAATEENTPRNLGRTTDHIIRLTNAYNELCRTELATAKEKGTGSTQGVGEKDTNELCQEIVSRVQEIKETRSPVEVAGLLATGKWVVLSAVSGFEEGKEYGLFALGRIR